MKVLKSLLFVFIGAVVIAAAAFIFAKVHGDIHKVQQSAVVQKPEKMIGRAVRIVPTKLHSAKADQSSVFSEGPDPVPLIGAGQNIGAIYGVPVLMYHHVGDLPENADPVRKDLTVSTDNFTQQVEWLKSQGYQTVSLDRLYDWLKNGITLPKKSVLLTFDDGYNDVFQNAVPVLVQNGMSGIFGIISGYVGTADYATWNQILAARAQGMEIISHSFSHPDFATKSKADQTYDITKSNVDFTGALGSIPNYFIYPYGKYNLDTESILNSDGFRMSFTTSYGFTRPGENLLELPRVRVHGSELLQTFEMNLSGRKP